MKIRKYSYLLAAFSAICILASSCVKEGDSPTGNFNCHCSLNKAGVRSSVDLPFNGVSKTTATSNCEAMQATYSVDSTVATCAIQ